MRLTLFLKSELSGDGVYSSLWKREGRRDFIKVKIFNPGIHRLIYPLAPEVKNPLKRFQSFSK